MRAIKIKDILKSLDDFQIRIGFSEFKDDACDSIYESSAPFVIKKSEWNRALMLGMDLPLRPRNEWWTQFIELGYLETIPNNKDPAAWLQVAKISKDITEYHGDMSVYLERD